MHEWLEKKLSKLKDTLKTDNLPKAVKILKKVTSILYGFCQERTEVPSYQLYLVPFLVLRSALRLTFTMSS